MTFEGCGEWVNVSIIGLSLARRSPTASAYAVTAEVGRSSKTRCHTIRTGRLRRREPCGSCLGATISGNTLLIRKAKRGWGSKERSDRRPVDLELALAQAAALGLCVVALWGVAGGLVLAVVALLISYIACASGWCLLSEYVAVVVSVPGVLGFAIGARFGINWLRG